MQSARYSCQIFMVCWKVKRAHAVELYTIRYKYCVTSVQGPLHSKFSNKRKKYILKVMELHFLGASPPLC